MEVFSLLLAVVCAYSGTGLAVLTTLPEGEVHLEEPATNLRDVCEMKVTFNGYPLTEEERAYAVSGEPGNLKCDYSCLGSGLPPALAWFRLWDTKLERIHGRRKRVHTSFYHFHRVLDLYMKPVREIDFRNYSCVGYAADLDKWVTKNVTLVKGCPPDERMWCDVSRCISLEKRCDGFHDCQDGLDEMGCDCGPDETQCDDGHCVPLGHRCEVEEVDCPGCAIPCGDGSTTFSLLERCDGKYNCPNRRDELACECSPDEWQCDSGECVLGDHFCDGKRHCLDGSDEVNCTRACSIVEFTCGDGKCVAADKRCNSYPDCEDGSDEAGCPKTTTTTATATTTTNKTITTATATTSTPKTTTTTVATTTTTCNAWEFTCGNGACLPVSQRCDRTPNCPDGEDERGCACKAWEFTCGNGACLPVSQRCDRTPNCPDGEDERGCGSTTSPAVVTTTTRTTSTTTAATTTTSTAKTTLTTASAATTTTTKTTTTAAATTTTTTTKATTTTKTTTTSTTTATTTTTVTTTTPKTTTTTATTTTTVTTSTTPKTTTAMASTTTSVTTTTPKTTTTTAATTTTRSGCLEGWFACKSTGNCIQASKVCDSFPDCEDFSDEDQDCGRGAMCTEGQRLCPDQSRCYTEGQECDGKQDCADGWDELGCGYTYEENGAFNASSFYFYYFDDGI